MRIRALPCVHIDRMAHEHRVQTNRVYLRRPLVADTLPSIPRLLIHQPSYEHIHIYPV